MTRTHYPSSHSSTQDRSGSMNFFCKRSIQRLILVAAGKRNTNHERNPNAFSTLRCRLRLTTRLARTKYSTRNDIREAATRSRQIKSLNPLLRVLVPRTPSVPAQNTPCVLAHYIRYRCGLVSARPSILQKRTHESNFELKEMRTLRAEFQLPVNAQSKCRRRSFSRKALKLDILPAFWAFEG